MNFSSFPCVLYLQTYHIITTGMRAPVLARIVLDDHVGRAEKKVAKELWHVRVSTLSQNARRRV